MSIIDNSGFVVSEFVDLEFVVSDFVVGCHELVSYSVEFGGFSGKINLDL